MVKPNLQVKEEKKLNKPGKNNPLKSFFDISDYHIIPPSLHFEDVQHSPFENVQNKYILFSIKYIVNKGGIKLEV